MIVEIFEGRWILEDTDLYVGNGVLWGIDYNQSKDVLWECRQIAL